MSTEVSGDVVTTPHRVARPDAWESLLERVGRVVGVESEIQHRQALAAQLVADAEGGSWAPSVRDACEELSLHASLGGGTVAQAVADVGPEHPVVVREPDGAWILLTDRRGRRVEVQRLESYQPEWTRVGELALRLDPSLTGSIEWVAIGPRGLFREVGSAGGGDAISVSPWRRLRGLMMQERHDVLVALVYAIGVGLLTLTTPVAVQALVNTVAFGTLLQPLAVLSALLLVGLVFAGVLRALQTWVVEILQRRLFVRLVHDLAHRLPRVELSAFDRAHGPELVNRFFDLFTIQKASASLLIGGLELVLTATFGMLVLAFYHPLLLAFDVLLLLVVIGILFGLGRGATQTAVAESKAKYEVASWLEEIARHPAAFKLAGGPALAREYADQLSAKYITKRARHFVVVFRQIGAALALQAFASAGVLGIGGWLVIERQLTLGQLVAAELIVTLVVAACAKVGKHLETTYDLLAALDKVGQLVDLPIEPQHLSRGRATVSTDPRGAEITATNLSFGFERRETLFSGVSLHLRPGDRVVLSGQSGSGRSALVDVLLGLRRASAGRVELNGIDLDDLGKSELREQTALVRGGEIVVGTLAENVAFGRRSVDGPQIRKALRAVGLLDELARLPDGLATRIMPDGSPLSRGQARRLVLARAIVGRPSLLVVDGAIDGLDPETRAIVLDTVFASDAPWTLLVITDDPSVSVRCDRSLSLADGVLDVCGSPTRIPGGDS